MRRLPLFLSIVVALAAPGCFVFDESLYLARERDGGIDASDPIDAGDPVDSGADDAGPVDGGLPVVVLADDCTGGVPELTLAGVSVQRAFDTTGLTNDYANLGCIGRPQAGPDGFFSVSMTAGERWHFHVRRTGSGADPVIFLLDGMCLDLECDPGNALDACRTDSDEHLSIIATETGPYYVGIDSGNTEGFAGRVEVFRPVCGDGVQTHGESCEPGGVTPGVNCSSDCRVILAAGQTEHEVNDDAFMANVIDAVPGTPITVEGRIGALCEQDVFAIDVPAGGSVRASLLTAGGDVCPTGTPSARVQLLNPNGIVSRGEGMVRTGACPSIEATDTFANALAAGRYFLRVYALNEEIRSPFDYQLRVEIVP